MQKQENENIESLSEGKIIVFVGHRGVGKTSLAFELAEKKAFHVFDLDKEIEKKTEMSIRGFFEKHGEEALRVLEKEMFFDLIKNIGKTEKDHILVLGAGFEFELPKSIPVFWIQRETDRVGRVFLNRPRLEKKISALDEFFKRKTLRDERFNKISSQSIVLEEGKSERQIENILSLYFSSEEFFSGQLSGYLTVKSEWFYEEKFFKKKVQMHLNWGIDFFELRDDLLSEEQIGFACEVLPAEKILLSCRRGRFYEELLARDRLTGHELDWALELGEFSEEYQGEPTVLSLHRIKSSESFSQALRRLEKAGERYQKVHLKAALVTENWEDLQEGHSWYLESPSDRSFLPCSSGGRWLWYRLLYAQRMKMSFIRESIKKLIKNKDVLDQPTVLQRASFCQLGIEQEREVEFAAVLGSPVSQSLTPSEQRDFFARKKYPVLAIDLKEDELEISTLNFLKKLGLRAAAVTAPLKGKMLNFSDVDNLSKKVKGVNTLWWGEEKNKWIGVNTDLEGFRFLCREVSEGMSVLVWGGGGTLGMMQEVFIHADFASLRTGKLRNGKELKPYYDIVIWASGSQQGCFPELSKNPELVIDLSYAENSLGREFCLQWNPPLPYRSGMEMFLKQAEEQRNYWSRQGFEGKENVR